ncbi:MAG TPA: M23 family metallopeptidase [Sporichthya sp.]|nr:M23 family metallopeptidase [Sporichthya sp.]
MLLHLTTALALAVAIPAPADPGGDWQAPVRGPVTVVRAFQPPPGPYARGHRGVDLAAGLGEEILAAGTGQVSFAGRVAGRGVVVVTHPGGLRTSYEPVEVSVRTGERVAAGARLGALGRSAHCPAACLHWGLRRGPGYLDPMTLLDRGGPAAVRLLPLDGSPATVSGARTAWCAGRASPSSGSGRPGSPRRRRAHRPRPG